MYPIRCSTCGEPVAAYAPMFKFLINNPDFLQDLEPVPSSTEVGTALSPLNENTLAEKVFRKLGITEWCTRTALMNPTFFAFNMENRAVIEGLKNIDRKSVV